VRKIKTSRKQPIFMSTNRSGLPSNSSLVTVKNLTAESADLYIYGEIVDNTDWKWDENDAMPKDVVESLNQVDGLSELNIYINSPGGSVFAGLAIYNMLRRNKAKKIVHIDGVAASIASVIALAGDEIHIPKNAFMMVHKPWTIALGDSTHFKKVAEDLDKIESGMMEVYYENLLEGVNQEDINQMVQAETWLTGEEAAAYFRMTVIESKEVAASAKDYLKYYEKAPETLIKDKEKPSQSPVNQDNLKLLNELELLNL